MMGFYFEINRYCKQFCLGKIRSTILKLKLIETTCLIDYFLKVVDYRVWEAFDYVLSFDYDTISRSRMMQL